MGYVQWQHETHASPTRKMSGQNQDTFKQLMLFLPPYKSLSHSQIITIPSRFTFFYSSTSTILFLCRPKIVSE